LELFLENHMNNDIWIIVQHRERLLEESTFGLVAEARRLLSQLAQDGAVVAVALGMGLDAELAQLGAYGVSRVLYVEDEALASYQGELFSEALFRLLKAHEPNLILMADTPETADLCPRLAGMLETPLVTRVADLRVDRDGKPCAVRPVSNGYLFEEIQFDDQRPLIISFIPSVLNTPDPGTMAPVEILTRPLNVSKARLKTRTIRIIAADPEDLDLEEADIIVSGGRGVGKDESFEIIHELARTMGGSVAGTRPVIDWQALPYERQIGQTGKTVSPRLIINCGISGANEYTAGMEKSRLVIAVNKDPRARIFRFADLGVVGDLHLLLPLLISRINEMKELVSSQ